MQRNSDHDTVVQLYNTGIYECETLKSFRRLILAPTKQKYV